MKLIKYVINFVLENYISDIEFLNDRFLKEQSQLKKEDRDEQSLIEELNTIYGEGTLDLDSGTFTPNKSE